RCTVVQVYSGRGVLLGGVLWYRCTLVEVYCWEVYSGTGVLW
ncbi:hypothetical protein LEMLEM_LOCUS13200, partial [Lemmus lemmus]